MFKINSLRPVKYGKFELRAGDNQFEDANAIPADLRAKLLHFAEVPPFQERGILVFDPPNPWPELAPKSDAAESRKPGSKPAATTTES